MALQYDQVRGTVDILCKALDNYSLREIAQDDLGQNIDLISKGTNLRQRIFDLIVWAEYNGRLVDMIRGARRRSSSRSAAQALYADIPRWQAYMETKESQFITDKWLSSSAVDANGLDTAVEYLPPLGWYQMPTATGSAVTLGIPNGDLSLELQFEKLVERGFGAERYVERVIVTDLAKEFATNNRLIIVGEPGAGKTTALLEYIYKYSGDWIFDKPLPVYVPLAAYSGPESLLVFAAGCPGALGTNVQLCLQNGSAALFLDGLEEMPREGFRERVHRIYELLDHFDKTPVILTCQSTEHFGGPDFETLRIMPLSPLQQREYLCKHLGNEQGDRLFRAIAGQETDDQEQSHVVQEPAIKNNLTALGSPGDEVGVDTCVNEPQTSGTSGCLSSRFTLGANPLRLVAIAQAYLQKGQVPRTEYEVFEFFLETLLEREHSRRGHGWPGTNLVREGLAELALSQLLHKDGCSLAPATITPDALESVPQDVLDIARCATILHGSYERVKFTHRRLQEHLAAQGWLAQIERGGNLQIYWPDGLNTRNSWDDSLVRLTALLPDPMRVIEAVLPVNPVVAARCVSACGANQPPLTIIEKIQEALLRSATNTTAPAAERIAAGNALNILSDRRPGIGLRTDGVPDIEWCEVPAGFFVRSGSAYASSSVANEQPSKKEYLGGFAISKYPISNRQYQAYIEETGGGRNWRDPWVKDEYNQTKEDFYGYYPFEDDSDQWNHPVVRESWHSAWGFCRWLEKKLGYPIEIPTQEQWEKAVLGLDGKGIAAEMHLACPAMYNSTLPIGIFPEYAGPFGVMEITDCFQEYTYTEYKTRQPTLRTDGDEVIEVIDTFVNDTMSYLSTGDPWCAAVHIGAYCQDPSNSCGFRVVRLYPEVENDVETDEYHGSTAAPDPIDRCSDSEPSDTANEFGGEPSFWPVDDFPTRYIAIDDLSDELTIPP